ncbi:hypothetical protein LCGC14_0986710 [marine sediment metagenome]|uniref:Uncharacterized protein n=1 Tax=marine sediment metagenome TaxID=412755 RepID=A0A0F9N739_9ZZZZ
MKSKKPRLIVLKDPKLRKARENLRTILKLAYYDERERLRNLNHLYFEKDTLTPSQQKRDIQLGRMNNNLMTAFDNSILKCNLGAACNSYKEMVEKGSIDPIERPIDLDMGWLPGPFVEPIEVPNDHVLGGGPPEPIQIHGSWLCKKDFESLKDFHIDEDYISF